MAVANVTDASTRSSLKLQLSRFDEPTALTYRISVGLDCVSDSSRSCVFNSVSF